MGVEKWDLGGLSAELVARLPPSEENCIRRLVAWRWPGVWRFRCRRCVGMVGYPLRGRPRVFCCKFCGAHTSVTAGTLLHRTRVDLRCWFLAAELLARPEGCSSLEFARRTGLSPQTAWRLMHRLRAATVDAVGFLLRGPVHAVGGGMPCRPPNNPYRPAGVRTLADENGTAVCVAIPSRGRREDSLRKHAPHVTRSAFGGPQQPPANQMSRQLRHTHRTVSEKWLARYTATITFAWNHQKEAPAALVRLAVRRPKRRFDELHPPWEPVPELAIPRYRYGSTRAR